MATTPFLSVRPQPVFGRRPVAEAVPDGALLFVARCWFVATTFILIWVG